MKFFAGAMSGIIVGVIATMFGMFLTLNDEQATETMIHLARDFVKSD